MKKWPQILVWKAIGSQTNIESIWLRPCNVAFPADGRPTDGGSGLLSFVIVATAAFSLPR